MYWEVLRDKYEKLNSILYEKRKIVVFGCGKLGADVYPLLLKYNLFEGFIDNDISKQTNGYLGEKVWSLEEFMNSGLDAYIVVAATRDNTIKIIGELKNKGFEYKKDIIEYDLFLGEIFPLISYYRYDKLFVSLAQICVTERCTLRCINCAHACNRVSHNVDDMSIEDVKESADCFFSNIDLVKEFVLIGGEPFLYKHLAEAVEYIGNNYRNKILMFSITTNGTVLPNDDLIEKLKKYDVTVRISDYSYTIPKLRVAYEKMNNKLSEVRTIILDTQKDQWFDYGFGVVDNGSSSDELNRIFSTCGTPCREVRKSKYYYCVMARSVSENTGINIGLDEYLDLKNIVNREDFLSYEMGNVENGYLSMCRFCRGANAKNYLIPAAIQEK